MLDDGDVARLAAGFAGDGGVLAVEREGAGWDHLAWRVETAGGPWIVRVATDGTPDEQARAARRELAVMQLVRRRLGGWAAEAMIVDAVCLAYRRVPGVPLQDLLAAGAITPAATAGLARQVGALLRAIGSLDAEDAGEPVTRDDDGLVAWVVEVPRHTAVVEHLLTPAQQSAIERFLGAPLPEEPDQRVLQHNDLGAEHVIVEDGAISGIIDWSDAAITDPASELGRLLRDLGEAALPHVLDGYGAAGAERAALTERAWCYARCLIVEDLAYAVEHRPDLVAFELANLTRLFAVGGTTPGAT